MATIESTIQLNEQFRRAEKQAADLIGRIFDQTGAPLISETRFNGQPLNAPFIIFNAPLDATVDFVNPAPVLPTKTL